MKKVRMSLSVAAILFAVVAAFATNSRTPLTNHLVDFDNVMGCDIDGTCQDDAPESVCVAPENEPLKLYDPDGPICSSFDPQGKVWVD